MPVTAPTKIVPKMIAIATTLGFIAAQPFSMRTLGSA
jgi:hypothetical protein